MTAPHAHGETTREGRAQNTSLMDVSQIWLTLFIVLLLQSYILRFVIPLNKACIRVKHAHETLYA